MSSRTDPGRWREAKRILDEALERPAADRAAFIADACAGDESLRGDVDSLAAAADDSESILDAPVPVMFADLAPRSRVGERIGAYEVLGELGRGGMGVVFLARRADDEFEKKVAIKLVPGGLADAVALDRFRSERQILASLDHPNVARLLDGGTTEAGEPYFVMEYVEGEPLLEYCRTRGLSTRERLRIFRDVCAAVQYAHQNLVVHRDIKPGNILVTPDGAAKLLDFGIAKLLDPSAAGARDRTATLYRMLTPDYASPEQVRGQPITTASDVYALGVVLYELLTERRPYHVTTPEPAELLRLVCEEDPEKPSTVAPSRHLEGDLDAIVARAMRKEPERRYASASALSEDLGRHLEGRPVLARRGTTSYRAGKFLRRHRFGVAAAAVVLVALAGGVWATLREARRARAAEARAERRFNDVRKLANSFLFEFHDAIRDLPGSTEARALLVKRALEYLDGLSRESAGDRELRRELAEAYRRVGDVQGNPFMANLGDLQGARASYGKSIALLEPAVASKDASDDERATLATAYLVGGGLELNAGEAGRAVSMAEKGLALRRGLAAEAPQDARRQMDLAQAWQFVAFDLAAAGRDAEAAAALSEQGAILEARRRADPEDRAVRRMLSQNLYLRAEALLKADRPVEALEEYLRAADIQAGLVRDDPASVGYRRDLAHTRMQAGNAELARGDAAAALEHYRSSRALFEELAAADRKSIDPVVGVAMSRHNAGEALEKLGRPAEALGELRGARESYEQVVAASPSNAWVAGMLAMVLVRIADFEAAADPQSACSLYRRARDIFGPAAAEGFPPDRRVLLERARARSAECAGGSPSR